MTLYRRVTGQADLLEAMIGRLGVRDALNQRRDHGNVMRRAAGRCMHCSESAACARWLEEHDSAEEAPSYCRNHDLFERLKHSIEAERQDQI